MNNTSNAPVHRFENGAIDLAGETVASECLIHIHVNDEHLTSLLASPEDLSELATGHLRTEYNINPPQGGHQIQISTAGEEFTIHVELEHVVHLSSRNTVVTTSCGGCEQHQLSTLVEQTPIVSKSEPALSVGDLIDGLERMREQQPGFRLTGGMHAAGLLFADSSLFLVKEDIGRHNAVDKTIGSMLMSDTDVRPAALLLSGRCGWDIVAKAASMNIPIIASIGAASSLAATTARASNMTLVTFAKDGRAVVIGAVDGRLHRNH